MPPTENATRNHDLLFPGHVSTPATTDPELVEYFDDFAFDEVLAQSQLEPRTRLMVQLAAQAVNEYRAMLVNALRVVDEVTPA